MVYTSAVGLLAVPSFLTLCCTGKQERQDRLSRSRSQPAMSASIPMLNGSPSLCASHYMPKASMRHSSWHTHSDTFGAWPYMSSEYSRERMLLAQQRKQSKELQMSEQDFVVPKTALPIRGQGCFSQLEYDLNPYPVSTTLLWLNTGSKKPLLSCVLHLP